MSDEGVTYDFRKIREMLLATFSAEELDSLFLYSDNPDLRCVR